MDDAQFYKELAALDQSVADRWRKVTGGKLKRKQKLDIKELTEIVGPIFDSAKITAKQAQALSFFFTWTWESYTKRALGAFYLTIEDAYTLDFFFAGSAAQLSSATQLKEFDGAIGATSGKIDFTSPGTGLTYAPDQYLAIKRLVADGKITVFEVDAAALHAKAGLYRTDIDRLVLYKGLPPSLMPWTIVHEATHAIQDWRDVVSKHKFTEADAYIAAAAAALGVDEKTLDLMAEYPAQKAAARLVLARKAGASNGDWKKAYAAVVSAVEKDPTYAEVKNKPFKPTPAEKGKDEKKILADLMQKMKSASP